MADSTPYSGNEPERPRPPLWHRGVGAALALYWVGLFVATHVPLPRLNELPTGSDKWMHSAAYAGLGGLLALWLSFRGMSPARTWVTVMLVCIAYAAIDELLQLLVASRSADVLDGLADVAGAAIGSTIVVAWRAARSRHG